MSLLKIENRVAKVRLNDAVTPWSTDDLISEIERSYGNKAVAENMTVGGFMASADDALETLEIEINSPGGSVMDGYRIYHAIMAMRGRGVRVVATVNTLAASMGSVILMAADEVRIVEGGRIMIHEAAQAVHGNAADHARAAKNLEEISDEIAQIYANRTGATKEEMRAAMKAETWMGAKESVERGFADSIIKFGVLDDAGSHAKNSGMSIFSRIFTGADAEAIAKLEREVAENETLRSDLATAQAKITELQNLSAVIAEKDSEIVGLKDEVKAFEGLIKTRDIDIEKMRSRMTEFDKKVSAAVVAALAETGVGEPIENTGSDQPQTKTREQFNALNHMQRNQFIRSGGKISN